MAYSKNKNQADLTLKFQPVTFIQSACRLEQLRQCAKGRGQNFVAVVVQYITLVNHRAEMAA